MKLGTANLKKEGSLWVLKYCNYGSFLIGTQLFQNINDALRFCRERDLKVKA
jgi:hypothetical protein